MRLAEEFWSWARGTRPRPPPGPRRPAATLLLYAAAFAHLPLVYLLVRDAALAPPFAISVGLVAMGLAWAGGVTLEGRRPGTTRFIAGAAVAEGLLGLLPQVGDALGSARWVFAAIALLAGAALVVLLRRA